MKYLMPLAMLLLLTSCLGGEVQNNVSSTTSSELTSQNHLTSKERKIRERIYRGIHRNQGGSIEKALALRILNSSNTTFQVGRSRNPSGRWSSDDNRFITVQYNKRRNLAYFAMNIPDDESEEARQAAQTSGMTKRPHAYVLHHLKGPWKLYESDGKKSWGEDNAIVQTHARKIFDHFNLIVN